MPRGYPNAKTQPKQLPPSVFKEPAAPPVVEKRSGEKVTVGCKVPKGLLLRIFDFTEHAVPVLGGGQRMERISRQVGHTIRVNGPAVPFGKIPRFQIIGGYGLTHNVDKDFISKWLEQNAESDLVVNGMIFVENDPARAGSRAEEQQELKSGMEPLDPEKDERAPKSLNSNLTDIETAIPGEAA